MQNLNKKQTIIDLGLNFNKNEFIHVHFSLELKNFVAYVFLAKIGFI